MKFTAQKPRDLMGWEAQPNFSFTKHNYHKYKIFFTEHTPTCPIESCFRMFILKFLENIDYTKKVKPFKFIDNYIWISGPSLDCMILDYLVEKIEKTSHTN